MASLADQKHSQQHSWQQVRRKCYQAKLAVLGPMYSASGRFGSVHCKTDREPLTWEQVCKSCVKKPSKKSFWSQLAKIILFTHNVITINYSFYNLLQIIESFPVFLTTYQLPGFIKKSLAQISKTFSKKVSFVTYTTEKIFGGDQHPYC